MSQLVVIMEKLKEHLIFAKDYEITKEKWFDEDVILVKRPGKSTEEKIIYDPYIGMDYNQNFCFIILIVNTFILFSTLKIIPLSYHPNRSINSNNILQDIGSGIGETPYTQTITIGDVNISDIKKYIVNTEWKIINKRTNALDYLASNEYQCSKCKCKIVNVK